MEDNRHRRTSSGKDSLFYKEEAILARAHSVIEDTANRDPEMILAEFALLTKGYKRLLRLTRNLTRVSDRSQHKLHTTTTELDAHLGRHVGKEIKDEILKGSGKSNVIRNQNLTVCFVDIRGFTSFSENRSPGQVIRFLKEYYEYSLGIVHKYNGLVKSFMGDGVMLVFGYNQENHTSDGALCFALEILERLPDFNYAMKTDVRLGIGLHSGPTAAGNIGTEDRTEFAVIGNTVNMASRIESETKTYPTPILFSSSVVEIMEHAPRPITLVDTIMLRGQQEMVDLYTFADLDPPTIQ